MVLGHSSDAVTYARKNDHILLLNSAKKPYFFESNTERWFKEVFSLALEGLIPFGVVRSVNIASQTIRIIASNGTAHTMEFDRIHIFEDRGLICENEILEVVKKKNMVVDWVNTHHMGTHSTASIYTPSDFVKEIHFFESDRVSGRPHNDIVVVSYLNDEELRTFEYSDTMVRFKLEHLLRDSILGAKNGVDRHGNTRYHKPKFEPSRREVRSRTLNIYKGSESIMFYHND